ncbi:ABC transporter ATP-binding protein [Spirillospora sp. NPDC050679]
MNLLEVRGLQVQVPGRDRPLLRGVDLAVAPEESVGLVGESGSGKSLTTRAVMRLLPPGTRVDGQVLFEGRDLGALNAKELRRWRSTDVAVVFQDPRAHINPVRTVGDSLLEGLVTRAGDRAGLARQAARLLREVGIPDPDRRMRQHPHELSGGLLQRVMIASALLRRPKLLIADEPTTALDVTTQSDVMAILEEQRRQHGMALLFITHDLDLAAAVCDRIAVMYAGAVVEESGAPSLLDRPGHPYTAGLLRCRPELGRPRPLQPIAGRPISGAEVQEGCAFAPRCPAAMDLCHLERPPLEAAGEGLAACHLWQQGRFRGTAEVLHV